MGRNGAIDSSRSSLFFCMSFSTAAAVIVFVTLAMFTSRLGPCRVPPPTVSAGVRAKPTPLALYSVPLRTIAYE